MKKKNTLYLLILVTLLVLPLSSALDISDTTFFSTQSNFTIFVDFIRLDNVTVSNTSIIFTNLTSLGSNFINTNATFPATASFIGLDTSLAILNVNTSIRLFTSSPGNQNFNATFISGHTIQTIRSETQANLICGDLVSQFVAYPVLIGLLGTMILLGIIIIALTTSFISFNGDTLDRNTIIFAIVTLIAIAILVIVAIIIIGSLCILF